MFVSKRKIIHSSGYPLALLNSNVMGPYISNDEESYHFMKYCISIIAIAILLISCSHGITQHFPKDKKLTDPAEIIIIRNKNFVCGGQSTTIFLDGLDIAHLRTGEYVSVLVESGVHHIRAVPFWGSGREISANFEERKKYYLLISLLELWDYEYNFFDVIFQARPGCDFEIEKISEEKGLERIKRSKNLIEMETEYKIATEAVPTEKEKPKLASLTKSATIPRIGLRRQPMDISSEAQVTKMLKRYGFFDSSKNTNGSFNNHFVDNKDGTVTDKATGLMWQKSGTLYFLENKDAKKYIDQLNTERFAGHSDWRLPNVEQLASLLEKDKINGVHLDPVFSNRQTTCWTVDDNEASYQTYKRGWVVNFKQGQIFKANYLKNPINSPYAARGHYGKNYVNYVKAVRSTK